MVVSIFYDLETSDAQFYGQIINYAFVAVDDALKEISSCCGTVKLSILELPSPGAMLANRVNPFELQKDRDALSEFDATRKIHAYIESIIAKQKEAVPFIGFNSAKFDLQYLRTVFIRNGLNPYFGGKIISRDLYLLSKKLSLHPKFPRPVNQKGDSVSLKLESITRSIGLLDGPQLHESKADVLLTVSLAEYYLKNFGADIRTFEPVALPPELALGECVWKISPKRTVAEAGFSRKPFVLHDADQRSALFIDLSEYKEGHGTRKNIEWINKTTSLFMADERCDDPAVTSLAIIARKELNTIKLNNFFDKSSCDIECDIYRLTFNGNDALRELISGKGKDYLEELSRRHPEIVHDVKVLSLRYRLRNHQFGIDEKADTQAREFLRKYAIYRYGGGLQKEKNITDPRKLDNFAPTYKEVWDEVALRPNLTDADKELCAAVREYCEQTEIFKLCGEELKTRVRLV
jgi:exonuclease I